MLFLQSVTKHADKLKQTGESKVCRYVKLYLVFWKDGGVLLKDNFEGVTWAYKVGSQSMVCPIIVEDLNSPCILLVSGSRVADVM
ncbi:putative transcription factor LHW [Helianthus anomalus]